MNFINLTPHAIRIRLDESTATQPLTTDIVIPPSGQIARVDVHTAPNGMLNIIPDFVTTFGPCANLPEPSENTIFIVSSLVLDRAHRSDLRSPLTDNTAIRDAEGHVFAVRGLQQ